MAWADDFTWVEEVTTLGPTSMNKINKALRELKGLSFNPMDYAATGDGVTADDTAIAAAAAAAKAAGGSVLITKNHAYAASLTFDSVPVYGLGKGAKLTALTPASSTVTLSGSGSALFDVTVTCPTASVRLSTDSSMGVLVSGSDVQVRRVTVDTVASGGFKVSGGNRVKIVGCTAKNTLSDGFHVTNASQNVDVLNCYATATGDDCFAVVSNGTDSAATKWIRFVDCAGDNNTSGSGFGIHGGQHVVIQGGSVYSSFGAAVYIVSDASVSSYPCQYVNVSGVDADTVSTGIAYGGVYIAGYAANVCSHIKVSNVSISNQMNGNSGGVTIGAYVNDVELNNVSSVVSADFGIVIGIGASASPPQDIRVKGGLIDSPLNYGIYADYVQGVLQIDGVTFRNVNTGNTGVDVVRVTANATAVPIRFTNNNHLSTSGASLVNFFKNLSGQAIFAQGNYSFAGKTVDLNGAPAIGELSCTQITAPVSVTATTSATANTVVTAPAYAFDGVSPLLIEADFSSVVQGTTWITFVLYDGSTELGEWGWNTGLKGTTHLHLERELTPSAGTHTYSIRAFVDAGTGHVYAGTGAINTEMPGLLRLTIPSPPR